MKKIAIQGIKGCFHHVSIIKLFWVNNYEILECKSFNQIPLAVTSKEANLGIIAIDNSIIGSILSNYIILFNNKYRILNSVVLYIEQNLIGFFGEKINKILSHSIALQQCVNFISRYTHIKTVEYSDTALSALYLSNNILKKKASIASKLAAKECKLKIIYKNIQNISNNFTRFVIIEISQRKIKKNFDKSSILFCLNTNSYNKILNAIANKNLIINNIISFNISFNEYKLYIDFILDNYISYEYFKSKIKNQSYTFFIIGEYINIIII